MTKTRIIFQAICFQDDYLIVSRSSTGESELILGTFSEEFKDKVSIGLLDWIGGVYFVAKLEKVSSVDKVYNITDIEEDIFPVPSWIELFLRS